jgi:hypothetical protein
MQLALKTKGLRSRRRLLANVTGRRRELAHLRYRVSDQAENTGGLTTALTLDKNETSDRGIVVHGVHLLSPLCPPERGNLTGGRLYSAMQWHKRRSSIGRLSHRPLQKYARLKVRQPPARAPARTCASSGSEAGHRGVSTALDRTSLIAARLARFISRCTRTTKPALSAITLVKSTKPRAPPKGKWRSFSRRCRCVSSWRE